MIDSHTGSPQRGWLARLAERRRQRQAERDHIQRRIDAAIDAARLRDYRGDLEDRHTGWRTP